MDRVEEFLGDRLHGRPVPPDLRRLVELQLDGVLADDEQLSEMRLLGPGELHPLQEPPVSSSEPVTDSMLAAHRALGQVLEHVAILIDGFDGRLFGYWLHPDEPSEANPPIVVLDTEGTFEFVKGTTLADALVDIEFCEAHGVPFTEDSRARWRRPKPTVDPNELFDTLYERERRFTTPSAISTDDTAPIGHPCDDPRVVAALTRHGFPPDLGPLIEAADVGTGEITLSAPGCSASIELRQQNEHTWYLYLMTFRQPDDDRPPCTDLPFGFALNETRAQARARAGEPQWEGARGNVAIWRFGPLELHIAYDTQDVPLVVRVFPKGLVAMFRYYG